jgi:hypothetical protein
MQPVSKRRIGKHALLETAFPLPTVRSGYKQVAGWRSSSGE